ncbi:MAG: hypothetical protein L0Z62_20315 [Gemmataceae bacterium]|nr:hypothetical protein [Gemmataceae bacterium]
MSQDIQGLTGLESVLKGLAPAAPRLDRDALLFRAGQASVPRPGRLWPCATCLLALVAGGLGLALAVRPEAPVRERVVFITMPAPEPPGKPDPLRGLTPPARQAPVTAPSFGGSAEQGRLGYHALSRLVLRWGIEGLPRSVPAAPSGKAAPLAPAPSYRQLRVSLQTGGEL